MIKIYKDFFDPACLKYIEETIEKSKNTDTLRASYPSNNWNPQVIHESAPVMIYYMTDGTDILLKRLREVIDTKIYFGDVHFMIYYWPMYSYIPWHDDGHTSFTATFYCNRYWNKDWGGLFLYEKDDNILAEVPEWNKLIVQTARDPHSTTSVTKPYWARFGIEEKAKEIIQSIRTTIQIFYD